MVVSNTDDHLRNHGFLLMNKGWRLAPAFDINPTTDKEALSLNVDMDNNALDIELAMSVGEYFHLSKKQMTEITDQVKKAISNWSTIAAEIGIPRSEQELMRSAFRG